MRASAFARWRLVVFPSVLDGFGASGNLLDKANATRLIHGEAIVHIVDLSQEPLAR